MQRRLDGCAKSEEPTECGEYGSFWLITGLHVTCPKFGVPKMKKFEKTKKHNAGLVECKLPSPDGGLDPIAFKSDSIQSIEVMVACLKWRHTTTCYQWLQHSGN